LGEKSRESSSKEKHEMQYRSALAAKGVEVSFSLAFKDSTNIIAVRDQILTWACVLLPPLD
jgi:hypothetical protein